MTTRITIRNESESNGDVIIHAANTCEGTVREGLFPGQERSIWITDNSVFVITETWPTKKPPSTAQPST